MVTGQESSTFYILDGSGSMWGEMGDKTKIEIARKVFRESVTKSDKSIGLVAYGHRNKSDCNDIEFLMKPEEYSQEQVITMVDGINPTGKTPLARSTEMVISYLKEEQLKSTIVLITDGIETCEGDLCDLVKRSKEEGIDFVLHIVGFGLGSVDRQPLECAAQASGGRYIDANDEKGLSDALEKASGLEVEDIAPRVSIECIKNGELVDALIEVYDAGTNDGVTQARSYTSVATNPSLIGLPYGKYDVHVSLIGTSGVPPLVFSNLDVNTDTIRTEIADFSTGSASIKVIANGALHDATVNIYDQLSGKRVEGGRTYKSERTNPSIFQLAPGSYRAVIKSVSINGSSIEKELTLNINPQKESALTCEFESGELNVQVRKDGSLCDAIVRIKDLSSGLTVAQGRTYDHDRSNPRLFILNPGKYEIMARPVKSKEKAQSYPIEINAGAKTSYTIEW